MCSFDPCWRPSTGRHTTAGNPVAAPPLLFNCDAHWDSPRWCDGVSRVNHLPVDVRSAIRFFAFYVANGTLDLDLLDGIDYKSPLMASGSALEQTFAVFANVLEVDENGTVRNGGDAQYRAAQWVRSYCDPGYQVQPPFQLWELELH
jgi:hypothetical protein